MRQGSCQLGPGVTIIAVARYEWQRFWRDVEEHRFASPRPRQHGAALVDEDAGEPRGKALALLVLAKRVEGAQEGILQRLLRILTVADDAERDPRAAIVMPIHEARERLDVAIQDTVDDREVIHLVLNNFAGGAFRHIPRRRIRSRWRGGAPRASTRRSPLRCWTRRRTPPPAGRLRRRRCVSPPGSARRWDHPRVHAAPRHAKPARRAGCARRRARVPRSIRS